MSGTIVLCIYNSHDLNLVHDTPFDTGDFPGGAMAVGWLDGFAAAHNLRKVDQCLGNQERYALVDIMGTERFVATIE